VSFPLRQALLAGLAFAALAGAVPECAATTLTISGKTPEESCAEYTTLLSKFVEPAVPATLSTSVAWSAFEREQIQNGNVSLIASMKAHGDAAMRFSKPGLRSGFIMTACLEEFPAAEAATFSDYYFARCANASEDAWGRACFMPATQELSKCLRATRDADKRLTCVRQPLGTRKATAK